MSLRIGEVNPEVAQAAVHIHASRGGVELLSDRQVTLEPAQARNYAALLMRGAEEVERMRTPAAIRQGSCEASVDAFVAVNFDRSAEELTAVWALIERVQQRNQIEQIFKEFAARVRARIVVQGGVCLFDALASIGANCRESPGWHGGREWTGPILFSDSADHSWLMRVEDSDHEKFTMWHTANPNFTDAELQAHGRDALMRIYTRPIDPKDYM